MARLTMQTRSLQDAIGSNKRPASALGALPRIRDVFADIEKTAKSLESVWQDEAQRIFMDKFIASHADILAYLTDLESLLSEMWAFTGHVNNWDNKVSRLLSDPRLNG